MQSKEDLSPAITKAAMSPHALSGRILQIRGQRVLLDADLAELYEVDTKRLNEQVKRNADRFPADFMFQLTPGEFTNLKSQFATSSWGGRRKLPFAFTEHGAIVKKWCLVHQAELQDNWQRAQRFEPLDRIQGADRD